ncbi:hypothetical protein [Bacillus cereus group sp. BfR-BA-01311]|uniref:hypothetical protein n=1 Tax=Bacillus cereus group sp. BfR-BA-01311 TaxID=2920288 RepID=UPI001F582298
MNIKAIEFAAFFGYKLNHTPQGFTNIDSDFSKVKIAEEEKSENRKKLKWNLVGKYGLVIRKKLNKLLNRQNLNVK